MNKRKSRKKPLPLSSTFNLEGQSYTLFRSNPPYMIHNNTEFKILLGKDPNVSDDIILKSAQYFMKIQFPQLQKKAGDLIRTKTDQQKAFEQAKQHTHKSSEQKTDPNDFKTKNSIVKFAKHTETMSSDSDSEYHVSDESTDLGSIAQQKHDQLIELFTTKNFDPTKDDPHVAMIINSAESIENNTELNNAFNLESPEDYTDLVNKYTPGTKLTTIFGKEADHNKANLLSLDDIISYSKMIDTMKNEKQPSKINITGKFDLDEHIIFLIKEMRIQLYKLIHPNKLYLNNQSHQPLSTSSTHTITNINDYIKQFENNTNSFEIEPASYIPTIDPSNEVISKKLTEIKTNSQLQSNGTCDILKYDTYPIYKKIALYECTCNDKLIPNIECKITREQSSFVSTLLCHQHWTNILLNDNKNPNYCKFSKSQIPTNISKFNNINLNITKVKSLISSLLHTTQQLTKITTKYSHHSIPTQFNSKTDIKLQINHNTCATLAEFQNKQRKSHNCINNLQNQLNALITESAISNHINNYLNLHYKILKILTSTMNIIPDSRPFKKKQTIDLLCLHIMLIAQLIQLGHKINICANQLDKLVQHNLILQQAFHKRKLLLLIKSQQQALLNNNVSKYISLHLSNNQLIIKSTSNKIKSLNKKINNLKTYIINPITEFRLVEQKQLIFNPRGVNFRNKPKTKTKTKTQSRTKQKINQNRTRKQPQIRQNYQRQKPRPKAKPNPRTKFTRQPRKQTRSAKKKNKQRKNPWRSNQPARSSRKSNSNNWRARPPRH